MAIRLEQDIKLRLERLSEATQRSKSFLAAEAIRDFLDVNEWQVNSTNPRSTKTASYIATTRQKPLKSTELRSGPTSTTQRFWACNLLILG